MSFITSGLGKAAHWLTTYRFHVTTDPAEDQPPYVPGDGVFTKPYSPLITGGLGMSACCGLLLGGLGSFSCFVGITPPPSGGGGGGGSFPVHPSIYVPWPKSVRKKTNTRVIVVTVKISDKKFTKNYLIPEKRTKIAVKVINFLNFTASTLTVGVNNLQRTARKVKAIFKGE